MRTWNTLLTFIATASVLALSACGSDTPAPSAPLPEAPSSTNSSDNSSAPSTSEEFSSASPMSETATTLTAATPKTKLNVQRGATVAHTFTHKSSGLTLNYSYSAEGKQHYYQAGNQPIMLDNPASLTIDFGDGSMPDGANSGISECLPDSPLLPYAAKLSGNSHTYGQAGTYIITVKTTICGDNGPQTHTTTQKVTVSAQDPTPANTNTPKISP